MNKIESADNRWHMHTIISESLPIVSVVNVCLRWTVVHDPRTEKYDGSLKTYLDKGNAWQHSRCERRFSRYDCWLTYRRILWHARIVSIEKSRLLRDGLALKSLPRPRKISTFNADSGSSKTIHPHSFQASSNHLIGQWTDLFGFFPKYARVFQSVALTIFLDTDAWSFPSTWTRYDTSFYYSYIRIK